VLITLLKILKRSCKISRKTKMKNITLILSNYLILYTFVELKSKK
jgi:hypothetical protein